MKCGRAWSALLCFMGMVVGLSLAQSAGAQVSEAYDEFELLCEQDPAPWIELYGDYVYDLDGDGVPSGADRCEDKDSGTADALRLLAGYESILADGASIWVEVRTLLIQGANGTTDSASRELLAMIIASLFDELFEFSNREVSGRYVFAGILTNAPPFELIGDVEVESEDESLPEVRYVGDHQAIQRTLTNSGRLYALSIPGDVLLFGDLDGDGSYPDPGVLRSYQG